MLLLTLYLKTPTLYPPSVQRLKDDDVHYIDAVTMDTQTPWHELKMDSGKKYETYKIAPTFGYVCKDENGEPGFCKDMKVRYCCANKQGWKFLSFIVIVKSLVNKQAGSWLATQLS